MLLSFFLSSACTDRSGLYNPGPGVYKVYAWTNLFSVEPNTPYLPQGFFCKLSINDLA